jgi:hypothetical protein
VVHPPEKYESLIGSSSQLLGKMKNSCSKPPTRSTITTITRKKPNQTSSSATLPIVAGPTAVSFLTSAQQSLQQIHMKTVKKVHVNPGNMKFMFLLLKGPS